MGNDYCASEGCNKRVAELCGHRMCAADCLAIPVRCGCPGHHRVRWRAKAKETTSLDDGFELARPQPTHPYDPPALVAPDTPALEVHAPAPEVDAPAPEAASGTATQGRSFPSRWTSRRAHDYTETVETRDVSATMVPLWLQRWRRDRNRHAEKVEAEQQRRENEKELDASANICWYPQVCPTVHGSIDLIYTALQDGRPAEHHTVRGVKTFPTLKLSQVPRVLQVLDLKETDDIEVYDLNMRHWARQCVSDTLDLKRQPVPILRRIGVSECPDIDTSIELAERAVTGPSRQGSAYSTLVQPIETWSQHRGKWPREHDNSWATRPANVPRRVLSQTSPFGGHYPATPALPLSPLSSVWPPSQTLLATDVTPLVATSTMTSVGIARDDWCSLGPAVSGPSTVPSPASLLPSHLLGSSSSIDSMPSSPSLCSEATYADNLESYLWAPFGLAVNTPAHSCAGVLTSLPLAAPSPFPAALPSTPLSYSPDPSPGLFVHPPTTPFQGQSPAYAGFVDDTLLDELWATFRVYVPPGCANMSWPVGLYARDVAKGFTLMAALEAQAMRAGTEPDKGASSKQPRVPKDEDLPAAFAQVFPGCKFVHATYYAQRAVWRKSTEQE